MGAHWRGCQILVLGCAGHGSKAGGHISPPLRDGIDRLVSGRFCCGCFFRIGLKIKKMLKGSKMVTEEEVNLFLHEFFRG